MIDNNVILNDFLSVEFDAFQIPIIAVYEAPTDFPNQYVARIFDKDKVTRLCMVHESLDSIQAGIPSTFRNLGRSKFDQQHIISCYSNI